MLFKQSTIHLFSPKHDEVFEVCCPQGRSDSRHRSGANGTPWDTERYQTHMPPPATATGWSMWGDRQEANTRLLDETHDTERPLLRRVDVTGLKLPLGLQYIISRKQETLTLPPAPRRATEYPGSTIR